MVEEAPEEVYVEPKPKRVEKKIKRSEDGWEIKDRVYYLKARRKPLSYSIKSSGIYWFDEEKGYEREIKYCQNQRTCFVDEMKGDQRLEHIVFRSGSLFVEKEKTVLQKFLSLHPANGNIFVEINKKKEAQDVVDNLNAEVDALIEARQLDIEQVETIGRVLFQQDVTRMSTAELKRDILIFAKQDPKGFLTMLKDPMPVSYTHLTLPTKRIV